MTDFCAFEPKGLITLGDALQLFGTLIAPVDGVITTPLDNALGRVLAVDVLSPVDLPYDRNSAMDGYAIAAPENCDQPFALQLSGTSWAGKPFEGRIEPGTCVRIFTGAVVPAGADSVVMQEQVSVEGEHVIFPAGTKAKLNIREQGEEVRHGELLCAQGKKISAADIGLMAAAGITHVNVKRQMKVGFFSTGDELIPLGKPLSTGKIYDSNSHVLPGLLTGQGLEAVNLGVLPDNKTLIKELIEQAAETYDLLISTGGASVGDADYIKDVLADIGDVGIWKIAVKPGKPLIFGKVGRCYFFGLPGNPVSMMVTFSQLVAPVLNRLAGATPSKPLRLRAICTTDLKKSPGRQEFQRGVLTQDDAGQCFVASSGQQGSHILSSMSRSNCYIVLPSECGDVQCGDTVLVEPFQVNI